MRPIFMIALLVGALSSSPGCSDTKVDPPNKDTTGDGAGISSAEDIPNASTETVDTLLSQDGSMGDHDASETESKPLPKLESPLIFEPGSGDATPRVQTAVALGSASDVAVVWTGANEDNSLGIRFGLYGLDGSIKAAPYRLSTSTQGVQNEPSVCALSEGGFVVAWSRDTQSLGPDGENLEIRFRIVDADGLPLQENDTRVLSEVPGNHWLAEVACTPSGGFVVAGVRPDTDGITFGVFAWRYDKDGAPEGTAVALNTTPEGTQTFPDVAVNANGAVVVVWSDQVDLETGESQDRVLLRWLPASGDPGDLHVIAGSTTTPALMGQVASSYESSNASVAALLAGGTLGLWSLGEEGNSEEIVIPGLGSGLKNPAISSVSSNTYALAYQQGEGAQASLKVVFLDEDLPNSSPTIIESGPQLPYPLSLDSSGGVQALGWTIRDAEGDYRTRVAIFEGPQ